MIKLAILLACITVTSSWRGITPLLSTREDVERIIGVKSKRTGLDKIKTKNQEIFIRYITEPCEKDRNSWNVPNGTVFRIDVIPQTHLPLASLNVDLSKFRATEVKDVEGVKVYTNREDGFEFEYYKRKDSVLRLTYFPTEKDSKLRCRQ